ncbi:MAG: hypothetical protein ACD_71C00130G0001 [uncultured bacterium (gcode 4)]|uniref:Uncharacterized protein n=1 Tax=uncultured bacterium (gcode 4) TaxID=1234023 RepID=K2A344_9BACT|nr:MAG: hypothetical protein ACD_71C00130G0001 [uncultured bacterium (gcode 4)]
MKTLTLEGNVIEFKFNPPIEETNFTSEDFDFQRKPSYATIGITELIQADNDIVASMVVGRTFRELAETAKVQDLDYLQVVVINQEETWIIDNGSTLCWMTKSEY